VREGAIVLPRQAPPVEGQVAPQNQGATEGQAGGIGSPSMVAPTLGAEKKQGQDSGKNTKQGTKGDKK
jgi:hypothetical protein